MKDREASHAYITIIYNHLHISIEVTKPYWKPHPIPPSHGPSPHPPTCPTRRSPGSSCSTGWLLHPPRRARCRATSGPCSSWCRGGNVRAAADWGRCGGWRGKLMETQIFPWSIGLKLFKSQYLRVKIKETSLEHQNISSKFRLYIYNYIYIYTYNIYIYILKSILNPERSWNHHESRGRLRWRRRSHHRRDAQRGLGGSCGAAGGGHGRGMRVWGDADAGDVRLWWTVYTYINC